jgi:hypothetical protein
MSSDEVLVLIVALGIAFSCWGVWLVGAVESVRFGRGGWQIAVLLKTFVASLGIVVAALVSAADPQVLNGAEYVALFLFVAAVAVAAVGAVSTRFGLNALDGAVRQRNGAALLAVIGLWLGTGLINAGANVGHGDTIYTTLGPLALALATFLLLVAVQSALTRGFHAVRIDRDRPSGLRLGGLFIAWGLILGGAVAGDYESARRTMEDFVAYGWPAMWLLIIAVPLEWRLRPIVERPITSWRVPALWASGFVGAAVAWTLMR